MNVLMYRVPSLLIFQYTTSEEVKASTKKILFYWIHSKTHLRLWVRPLLKLWWVRTSSIFGVVGKSIFKQSYLKEEHSEKVKTFFWWKDHKYILIFLSTYILQFSYHMQWQTLYIITRLALSKLHTYLDRRSRQTERLVLGPIICKKVLKIQIILCYICI